MSAVRKHASFNQSVNEKHERKVLKEEEQRLERMQKVTLSKKRPKFERIIADMDFESLELRVLSTLAA